MFFYKIQKIFQIFLKFLNKKNLKIFKKNFFLKKSFFIFSKNKKKKKPKKINKNSKNPKNKN
jgi:hypothetical protein